MHIDGFKVKSRLAHYPVLFHQRGTFVGELARLPNTVFAVDENVWRFHKNGSLAPLTDKPVIVLQINEKAKSLETVQTVYDRILQLAPKKNMCLAAIGGGITQDITGFAASTLYRGIKWIFVPTTLLAQADSCIGAKTSLNYKAYKNLVGTFYPPAEIHIYAGFLSTLSENDYFSGLGEMAKLSVIGGMKQARDFAASLDKLLARDNSVVSRFLNLSLQIKREYIESDEFDSGRRNILNFGHCFGHAIESAANFKVPHGTAVVGGILLANIVARRRGILSGDAEQYMAGKILLPLLSAEFRNIRLDSAKIIEGMKNDKKRTGDELALVMATDGGRMIKVSDLKQAEAVDAMRELNSLLKKSV